jgi:hypothetical protein
MKTLTSLVAVQLLCVSLIAQDAPIPKDTPLKLPPLNQELKMRMLRIQGKLLDGNQDSFLAPKRLEATEARPNPSTPNPSVEDRIATLEARIAALEGELEAQRTLIKRLQEQLDQQKKK